MDWMKYLRELALGPDYERAAVERGRAMREAVLRNTAEAQYGRHLNGGGHRPNDFELEVNQRGWPVNTPLNSGETLDYFERSAKATTRAHGDLKKQKR